MTEPDGMYGEDIRHALGALADLVVPTGDGLEKIRKRTRHRPPALAWLVAYGTYLPRALINMFRVPGSELILMARGQSTVFKRLWAGRRRIAPEGGGSPQAWLRPVLAASGALVIVVAVVLAVPRLQQTITPSGMSNTSAGHSLGGNNGTGGGNGETANASQAATSGKNGQAPPVGSSKGKCPGKTSTGSGSTGNGILPVGNTAPPPLTSGTSDTTTRSRAASTHCPNASASAHPSSSSPTSGTSPSSPGTSTSPAPSSPPPTTPIPPSGGDPPTPTSTAVTNSDSPSPGDSDTGGS